ncbi:MAG: hypothetical protein GKS06_10970 [Acidobacteria bacterium]|nr:hypothetical protein [Acidobacteriota bacterium]
MTATPKWYMPVVVVALLWNLLGCFAYLSDVMLSADALAAMPDAQRAIYEARPIWAVSATAIAVWGGALGCIGLLLKKSWANPALIASLVGIVVQDLNLFVLTDAAAQAGGAAYGLQGMVLIVGIALVVLGRRAVREGWIAS